MVKSFLKAEKAREVMNNNFNDRLHSILKTVKYCAKQGSSRMQFTIADSHVRQMQVVLVDLGYKVKFTGQKNSKEVLVDWSEK